MRLSPLFVIASAMVCFASGPAYAGTHETQAKGQSFPVSIGQPAPTGAHRDGPLFRVVIDNVNDLRPILAEDTSLVISRGPEFEGADEVLDVVAKIERDCDGPYSLDEGLQQTKAGDSWVQVSWVCDTSADISVREFLEFKYSPEISVAFSFRDGDVSLIFVVEQFPMPPNWRVIPMDAYKRPEKDPNG